MALLDGPVAVDDVFGHRQKEGHGEFCDGIGGHIGDIGDDDAALCGGLHVHDVYPHSLPGDVSKPGGSLHEAFRHSRGDSDQKRIGIADLRKKGLLRRVAKDDDPGNRLKFGHGLLTEAEPMGNDDFHRLDLN